MINLKMNNAHSLQDRESSFRFKRLITGNYLLKYAAPIMKENANEEDVIKAFDYSIDGTFDVRQSISVFAFRSNVKFVEDSKENKDKLKEANELLAKLIAKHGKGLNYELLKPVYDLIETMEFISPFITKDGMTSIPEEINVQTLLPKLNIGTFDEPVNNTKVRFNTIAYKSKTYIETGGEFTEDKNGFAVTTLARQFANDGEYDKIVKLYDSIEANDKFAKQPENLVYNTAICFYK